MSELLQINYLLKPPAADYPLALEAAQRALELEPDNAYALLAMAQVRLQRDLRLAEAESLARRSVESAPGLAENRHFLAEVLSMQNKHHEALQWIDSALQIEPYSALLQGVHGILLTGAGQNERAIAVFEELDRYSPKFPWQHRYHAYALMREGRGAEAGIQLLKRPLLPLTDDERDVFLKAIDVSEGRAYWTLIEERLPPQPRRKTGHHYFSYIEALAANGRLDEAMTWVKPMLELRSEAFLVLRMSPELDALREREDYREVMRSMDIPIYAPER
jgi:tetratricopeptide (TPR) repeat protein